MTEATPSAVTAPRIPPELAETIVDPFAYAEETPVQEAFARLRRELPLAVAQPEGFDPFWAVTRYADIQHVEKNADVFLNEPRSATLTTVDMDKFVREATGGSPNLLRSLVQMDNPDHFKYRTLTQAWFLPQNLRRFEERIRAIARSFVDHMESLGGQCDFARDVAFLYPLHVIMEILGVPEADEPRMLKLTQEIFGAADPELNRSGKAQLDAGEALSSLQSTIADFYQYFEAITNDRRSCPRGDVASVIANGEVDGQPLGYLEAMSYYIIVATAGHDTTSNTTAGGLWALLDNPEQLAKVQADPSLIPGFVEESIRWVTPVKHFMRTAVEDTEVAGQAIAKGDWLMLCYPSGNRDEAAFDRPFEFDVTRSPNKHVAFGYGRHVCLGQHLGRMEMRLLWEELLPRLKHIEFAGEPRRMAANFVCGPKSLPVAYEFV